MPVYFFSKIYKQDWDTGIEYNTLSAGINTSSNHFSRKSLITRLYKLLTNYSLLIKLTLDCCNSLTDWLVDIKSYTFGQKNLKKKLIDSSVIQINPKARNIEK